MNKFPLTLKTGQRCTPIAYNPDGFIIVVKTEDGHQVSCDVWDFEEPAKVVKATLKDVLGAYMPITVQRTNRNERRFHMLEKSDEVDTLIEQAKEVASKKMNKAPEDISTSAVLRYALKALVK